MITIDIMEYTTEYFFNLHAIWLATSSYSNCAGQLRLLLSRKIACTTVTGWFGTYKTGHSGLLGKGGEEGRGKRRC
jgi:hypothetical protein